MVGVSKIIAIGLDLLGSSFGRVAAKSNTSIHPDDANRRSENAVAAKGT